MKVSNGIFFITLVLYLSGCVSTPTKKFNSRDVLLTKPFRQIDTVIYISSTGLADTIIFFPAKVDTARYRSFEQGFDDQYVLNVDYILTIGSFHKVVVVDKFKNSERFYSCSISDVSNRELSFLGLIFDNETLDKLHTDTAIVLFNEDNATYKGVNINNGILSFKFSSNIGVLSYKDANGIEWERTK